MDARQCLWKSDISKAGDLGQRESALSVEKTRGGRNRVIDGKEAAFWHCTSEGDVEEERVPDLRRCERIGWPRRLIEAIGTDRGRWWKERPGRTRRACVALADFSYLVVLEEMSTHCVLVTAYPVEKEHSRKKLRNRCNGATEKG